ncbi:ATP-dependent RNA helicase HrpA [Stagnimonas aquatica]|uniref:ATP-dependent RNA helicase HrpA n=1 Tax=Stagnimonas aquatica TaxID=2689987 RepID=A0A3N0VM54_9GAMM|nr:ATP-dependent RNA helicase HrpA [Stagnimonas aquatica]ROH93108.1 ATP-dependent RNA helicase HrpA [Stagnimonas aquatica]
MRFDPESLLVRDVAQFARLIGRAQASGKPLDAARFARDLEAAQQRAANRRALLPKQIHWPAELPVVQAKDEIAEAIRNHQIIVLCGETGSGKTTQLPKLCLELGRGTRGLIGHTQPRRLAARSVANRIASELQTTLGELVGYETRFDRRVGERTLVKLMTDGILLAELQHDRELNAYDTIIIDEAHERSLNIDFLLGWLKRIAPRRPDLKIIITSATLDPERLSRHFGNAPILTVSGRTYPVDTYYREVDPEADLEDNVASAIDELWGRRPDGDVLVFLPGEREIHGLARMLPGRFPHAAVLPLYSRLPAAQQDKVFSAGGPARIVLATNVAETSVTVPGIRYVVDLGTARLSRYSPRTGVQQLQIEPVSQAAANQRAGRCGRVAAGICIRLYAEEDYLSRPLFTDPEILRSNLAGVILQMASLGLGDVDAFPWVDPPENRHISEGYRVLHTLGAMTEDRELTPLGRQLARLPLDPRVARIALAGKETSSPHEVWVLAAALSVQDPHEMPPESQTQARQKHAEWRHPKSDFFTLLNLWNRWDAAGDQSSGKGGSQRQLRKWCKEHYVSYLRMEEWEAVYKQIVDMVGDDKTAKAAVAKTPEELEKRYVAIHRALLTGLIDHIGNKPPEKAEYQGPRGRRFKIFPGSALAKKAPPWLMHAAIVHTSQVFARSCAAVEPEWLADIGAHLVKRVLHHPEWNAQRGEVTANEHVSLLGLPLLKRQRHYGSEEPREARTIFIREGLVRGEVLGKPDFLKKNLALIEEVREKEARLRRPDLLADESQLYRFYDARLPEDLCTVAALKAWLHGGAEKSAPRPSLAPKPVLVEKPEPAAPLDSLAALRGLRSAVAATPPPPAAVAVAPGTSRGALLTMREADVLRPGANADVEELFPDQLAIAGQRLSLSYQHDPGTDADGVSFHLPLAQLFALPAERFDWLVPGLLAGKIEALIKTLPQHLRRLCQPAAEYANAIVESSQPEGPLLEAICARFKAMTGVQLEPADFASEKLPAHFRPRLLVEDAHGEVLGEAESLAELQSRFSGKARTAFNAVAAKKAETQQWVRESLSDWDFGDLPATVSLPGGARAIPALSVEGERIALRLFESEAAAETAHAAGLRALLLLRLADRVRDLAKSARGKLALALTGTPHTVEGLARQLAERCADEVLIDGPVRSEAEFRAALERRGQFSQLAYQRLDELAAWLVQAVALRRALATVARSHPDAHADAAQQLATLLGPGFVTAIPAAQWPRIATYLKALALRLERLPLKPQKDAEAIKQIQPLQARLPGPWHPVRWLIEEWRIALFAQELRAQGAPTAARVEAALRG